eukprot:scaffold147365_cov37-Cyclotella_meneghiniana.AAC.1
MKAAAINPPDKGDQTLSDAAYSTPTRPPPGMPSISTNLTEQLPLPPQQHTNASTTTCVQPTITFNYPVDHQ